MHLNFGEIFILYFGRTQFDKLTGHDAPLAWENHIIVGANCIRPLLITAAAHHNWERITNRVAFFFIRSRHLTPLSQKGRGVGGEGN